MSTPDESPATPANVPTAVPMYPSTLSLERAPGQLKRQPQETVEQYEASTAQLQAMNEELRAINEELVTVNHALEGDVEPLLRANRDLQSFLASANIATVFLDRNLCIKRFTPPAVTLFNLIPADVGRPLSGLRGTLDCDALAGDAARVLDSLISLESEVRAADGRCFLARVLPHRTMDDHLQGIGLVFIDITRRKVAEEARLDVERRLTSFLRQATVPIAEKDLAGRYTMVNGPYCKLAGRTEAELLGQAFNDLTHPDDAARNAELFARLIRDGDPFEIEKRYVRPDGSVFWVHDSVSAIRGEAGQPASCICVTVDINERKLAEEALRRSEAMNRLILENAREVAIFTLGSDGAVTSWNSGGEFLFHWPAEEITGRSVLELLPPERRAAGVREHIETALREGRAAFENWFVRRDGSRFWSGGILTPMLEDDRVVGFLKIMRDLTSERTAQEERARLLAAEQAARREAEAANQTKDRFLASLSHELRTPLTPVQLALFGLRREKRLSVAGQAMLDMITRSVETEVRLIDDLLDVSRIVHGKLELRLETLQTHTCVRHALEVCGGDFDSNRQRLLLALEAPCQELSGDADRLKQVFWNLFKNAAKFTPEEGTITIRTRNPDDAHVEIEISDTGLGMDPETLAKVFDAFEQGSPDITHRFGGLGLGLAISHAIVAAHGGKLTAASPGPKQGSTFKVTLPLLPAA